MTAEQIKVNAELVVGQLSPLSDLDFGYNLESVQWLEGYIERLRQSDGFLDSDVKHRLMSVFGSYLGECIVRCYGGAWAREEEGWCVSFGDGNAVYPFAKVSKQLDAGLDEGISGFFRMIPVLFALQSKPSH